MALDADACADAIATAVRAAYPTGLTKAQIKQQAKVFVQALLDYIETNAEVTGTVGGRPISNGRIT